MFTDIEVCQIYEHIAAMCGHPDPAEACRLIIGFCKQEMAKITSQHRNSADGENLTKSEALDRMMDVEKSRFKNFSRR